MPTVVMSVGVGSSLTMRYLGRATSTLTTRHGRETVELAVSIAKIELPFSYSHSANECFKQTKKSLHEVKDHESNVQVTLTQKSNESDGRSKLSLKQGQVSKLKSPLIMGQISSWNLISDL